MKALPILAACALLGATGAASATTITVSWTQDLPPAGSYVGPVESLTFGSLPPPAPHCICVVDFVQPIDKLSTVISQDVTHGTHIPALDITEATSSGEIFLTLAFQDVLFRSFSESVSNQTDEVSFFFTVVEFKRVPPTNATPLPATLPLFATGLGGLGLLGWRRKRKAAACIIISEGGWMSLFVMPLLRLGFCLADR